MEKTITYNGTTCFYKVAGNGDAIVLLHGLCFDADMWDAFKEPFLATHTVIAPDLPGYNRSELPKTPLSVELWADAVKAILDAEHISSAIIIGHSMGGYVGLAMAEKYPNLVNKLGLFHSHPFADDADKLLNRQKIVTFIEKHGTGLFLSEFYPNLFAEANLHSALIEQLIERGGTYNSNTVVGSLQALMNRKDKSGVLQNFAQPVLFIIGKQDNAIPHAISLKQTHLAQVADVHILDAVGHLGMFEAPKKCQQILHNFITLHI